MDPAPGPGDILLKEDFRLDQDSLIWGTAVEPPLPITPLISSDEEPSNNKMNVERRAMWQRMRNSAGKKRLDCEECGFSTFQPAKFKKHVVTHSKDKPFACELCNYKTKRKCNLKIHVIGMHEGIKPYACQHCEYRSHMRGNLKTHQRRKHRVEGERSYICDVCEYSTNNSSSFNIHLRKHTGDEPFTCIECPFKSHDRSTLDAHLKNHDVSIKRKYVCRECSFRTNNSHSFNSHLIIHPVDVEREPVQGVQNAVHYSDDVHPLEKKKERKKTLYNCEECPAVSLGRVAFREHKRTHNAGKRGSGSKKKLYQCELCEVVSEGYPAQLEHQKTHNEVRGSGCKTEKKLYSCEECTVISEGRRAFREHKKTHDKKRRERKKKLYQCKQCEVVSEGKVAYIKHQGTHTRGSKAKLDESGEGTTHFVDPSNSDNDPSPSLLLEPVDIPVVAIEQDSKAKQYSCEKCGVILSSRRAFIKHKWTHNLDPKLFICKVKECRFTTAEEIFFKLHQKTCCPKPEVPEALFACIDCDFETADKSLLKTHECQNNPVVNAVFDQIIEVKNRGSAVFTPKG